MEIKEVRSQRDLNRFIDLPYSLYKNCSHYVPQLKRDLRDQFSRNNPFFRHAEVKYFLAENNGRICGRVASVINHRHREYQHEDAGFFGFFESENDSAVAGGLLAAVSADLKHGGMKLMRGPMNFSTNEECGFLLEGYDEDPMLMTPYNPSYYHELMEACGMVKAKDLYAFICEVQEMLPEKIVRVASLAEKRGITVRPVDKKRFHEEILVFRDIYNDAWEKNWGFIPLTDEEVSALGERLRQIAVPELVLIAEDNGSAIGFLGMVPDYNIVLKKMNGRMDPVSIIKGLYYSRRISDLRMLLLGIKKQYRNKGVEALLFREGFRGIKKKGGRYRRVEFSWVLEENVPVQRLVEMIGGRLYKKYRLYEKTL